MCETEVLMILWHIVFQAHISTRQNYVVHKRDNTVATWKSIMSQV